MHTFHSQFIKSQIKNSRDLFEHIASGIWQNMRDGFRLGLPPNEETITDWILLDIARHKFKIFDLRIERIYRATKAVESKYGLDWEWWIGSKKGWIRYGVQAKRIDEKGNYKYLKHVVNGESQERLLNDFCETNNAVPLYCFYNYLELGQTDKYWHCCKKEQQKNQLGCTITPSFVVNKAIRTRGAKNFSYIHSDQHTVPWRCLTSCPDIKKLYDYPNSDDSDPDNTKKIARRKFGQDIVLHLELPKFLSSGSSPLVSADAIVDYYQDAGILPKRVMVIEIPPETEPASKLRFPLVEYHQKSLIAISEQQEREKQSIMAIENREESIKWPSTQELNHPVNKALASE